MPPAPCLICDRIRLCRQRNNPWLHTPEFAAHGIDGNTARELAARVRANLAISSDPAGSS